MDYAKLRTELTSDPLTRGYAAMSIQQAADNLNTANRASTVRSIAPGKIVSALVWSEYAALTADQKQVFWGMVGAGDLDPNDAKIKAIFAGLFGAGTTTRANLIALATGPLVSRATELGLGEVTAGDVGRARAGVW
jgi:hypothetical protein